jgi:hypothetical protein
MWLYGILGSFIGGVIVALLAMLAARSSYEKRLIALNSIKAYQHEMLHRAALYMKGLAEAEQTASYIVCGTARPEMIAVAISLEMIDDARKWLAEFESQEEEFRKRHWRSPSKGKGRVPDPEEKERSDGR